MPALEKHIVLGADFSYITQITTTLKSIVYNNQHTTIYLMHSDIPQEWFKYINKQLVPLNCKVQEININNNQIKSYRTWSHISYATFFRYFIPQYISMDQVLYLDCDLIVTGNLDEFYSMELGDNYVAAVEDSIAKAYYERIEFNAGVLLINNKLWKHDNIMHKALDLNLRYDKLLNDADQSVLNMLFNNRWLSISNYYNYLTGLQYLIKTGDDYLEPYSEQYIYIYTEQKPLIIHYNTAGKPWLIDNVHIKYKEEWWFYHNLDWAEIYQHYQTG